MAKKILLGHGRFAFVDDEDFDWLSRYCWHFHKASGGAARSTCKEGKIGLVLMHREIMGFPETVIDHRDRDPLNNQKINLRICSVKENSRNRGPRRNSKSGFKGVHWNKQCRKWHAQIEVNGKNIYLGLFSNVLNAARAYDTVAREYFKEFAYLNFPDGED